MEKEEKTNTNNEGIRDRAESIYNGSNKNSSSSSRNSKKSMMREKISKLLEEQKNFQKQMEISNKNFFEELDAISIEPPPSYRRPETPRPVRVENKILNSKPINIYNFSEYKNLSKLEELIPRKSLFVIEQNPQKVPTFKVDFLTNEFEEEELEEEKKALNMDFLKRAVGLGKKIESEEETYDLAPIPKRKKVRKSRMEREPEKIEFRRNVTEDFKDGDIELVPPRNAYWGELIATLKEIANKEYDFFNPDYQKLDRAAANCIYYYLEAFKSFKASDYTSVNEADDMVVYLAMLRMLDKSKYLEQVANLQEFQSSIKLENGSELTSASLLTVVENYVSLYAPTDFAKEVGLVGYIRVKEAESSAEAEELFNNTEIEPEMQMVQEAQQNVEDTERNNQINPNRANLGSLQTSVRELTAARKNLATAMRKKLNFTQDKSNKLSEQLSNMAASKEENVYSSALFTKTYNNQTLWNGNDLLNIEAEPTRRGILTKSTNNLVQLEKQAAIKNGLYVYPQWAMSGVESLNKKNRNTQIWGNIQKNTTLKKVIKDFGNEVMFPKLEKMLERSFIGSQPTPEQKAKIQLKLSKNTNVVNTKLNKQGVNNWVHPVVQEIIQANDVLNEGGFGQISEKSLPLYAGRYLDEKGNIRTLPSPSEKYLNPTSKIQRETYLEAKILYNWNKLVHTVDAWNNIKSIPNNEYIENKRKKITGKLKEPEKIVPKYKTLQSDIAKYRIERAGQITNLERFKYLFWEQVFTSNVRELGILAKELIEAIIDYNSLFYRKRDGEFIGGSQAIKSAIYSAGETIKTVMENILVQMEPMDSTLESVENFGKQIKYGLSLVDSVLVKQANSIYNLYKSYLIPMEPISAQNFLTVQINVKNFKEMLKKDIEKGKMISPEELNAKYIKNPNMLNLALDSYNKVNINPAQAPSLGFGNFALNYNKRLY